MGYDSNSPTILYWFSPTCAWCEKNAKNFEALAEQAGVRYRFVPVSVAPPADLAAYAKRRGITVPLYSIDRQTAKSYGFFGTPTTMRLSPTGKVLNVWSGAYDTVRVKQLEQAAGVHLAGPIEVSKRR